MGCFWGIAIGWFYATQNGYFAVLVPQKQAAEMAGIYNFAALILVWLPPFVFTAMNEAGIPLNYGVMHLIGYFIIAITCLSVMPSWREVLAESHGLDDSFKSLEGYTQGEPDLQSWGPTAGGDVERQPQQQQPEQRL